MRSEMNLHSAMAASKALPKLVKVTGKQPTPTVTSPGSECSTLEVMINEYKSLTLLGDLEEQWWVRKIPNQ